MFEDIDKSWGVKYAPSLKSLNLEEEFKNSGYTDRDEFKKNKIKNKLNNEDINKRSLSGGTPYTFSPYTGGKYMGAPLLDNSKPIHKTTMEDKLNNKVFSPLKSIYEGFLKKVGSDLPNTFRDTLTASSLGVQTKQTVLGRLGNAIGSSEVTGYNPISKSNINIDYLSNKIDTDGRQLSPKESDGYLKSRFKTMYNNRLERIGAKNLEDWKKMHIEETAKSVRTYGANINPFDSGDNLDYVRHNLKDSKGNYITQGPPTKNSLYGNANLAEVRERDAAQLKEIEQRISSAKNNVKQFFNPVDREELSALESMQSELTERLRRIDGNFGASRINLDPLSMPKSVEESFEDLHNKRTQLYNQINSASGNLNTKGTVERAGVAFPQETLNDINNEIAKNTGMFDDFHVTNKSNSLVSPSHTKTFTPTFGTSGYGLGFSNAVKASRTEHMVRAANFMNPFGVGSVSATQAVAESFGIMNKAQRMQAAQARGIGKLGQAMVPGLGALQLGLGIYNKEDAGQIFEDIFSMGTSLAGWRTGTAIGGSITKASSISRIIGLGAGGLTGMALGYGVGVAAIGGIRDIISNESKVRNFAKKVSTKESMVTQVATQQSLTARQASLQKLAKSGLNDRGLLLGNESSILAGVM